MKTKILKYGTLSVGVLGLCALLAIVAARNASSKRLFAPAKWKRDTEEAFRYRPRSEAQDATRYLMVDDLLRKHQLKAMSLENLYLLLGPPDHSNVTADVGVHLQYWLGPDAPGPFGGLDNKWLSLWVNSNGTVAAYKAYAD